MSQKNTKSNTCMESKMKLVMQTTLMSLITVSSSSFDASCTSPTHARYQIRDVLALLSCLRCLTLCFSVDRTYKRARVASATAIGSKRVLSLPKSWRNIAQPVKILSARDSIRPTLWDSFSCHPTFHQSRNSQRWAS